VKVLSLALVVVLFASMSAQKAMARNALDTPCGNLSYTHSLADAKLVGNVSEETVSVIIRYTRGVVDNVDFPYPWHFEDAKNTDPWYGPLPHRTETPIRIEFPPKGFDLAKIPQPISRILALTTPDGITHLPPCPPIPRSTAFEDRRSEILNNTILSHDESSGLRAVPRFARFGDEPQMFCLVTTNVGTKTIRGFSYLITYLGSRDYILGTDRIVDRTTIVPGALGGTPPPIKDLPQMSCVFISRKLAPKQINSIDHVRVNLQSVDYADGTRWVLH
jgi:hypothetical protein